MNSWAKVLKEGHRLGLEFTCSNGQFSIYSYDGIHLLTAKSMREVKKFVVKYNSNGPEIAKAKNAACKSTVCRTWFHEKES